MMHMMLRRILRAKLPGLFAALLIGAFGCGDDPKPKKPKKRPGGAGKARAAPAAATAKGKPGELKFYTKIENIVARECEGNEEECEKEAEAIRHRFVTSNFDPDLTGGDNRDPFYSFVRKPVGLADDGSSGTENVKKRTHTCNERRLRAPNPLARDPRARRSVSFNDLTLTAIVLRGTKSFALFKDKSQYSHIVQVGDCLGKEKVLVADIGATTVKLELAQDADKGRAAQGYTRQLHPDELSPEDPETAGGDVVPQ